MENKGKSMKNEEIIKLNLKNNQTMIIRQVKANDAKQILAYLNRIGGESPYLLFGENEFQISVEREMEIIESIKSETISIMAIGLIDDEIVSLGMIKAPFKIRLRHTSDVSISVSKEHWGKGIGRAMMKAFIDFAKEKGITKNIYLDVHAGNKRALSLYESLGFEVVGVKKGDFFIDGEYYDAVSMALYL